MKEWLARKADFVNVLLDREVQPLDRNCCNCRNREGTWKCLSCLGPQVFCNECILSTHRRLPFHRVEHWTGDHFQPSCLADAGMKLHCGHFGMPCPRTTCGSAEIGDRPSRGSSDENTWQDHDADDEPSRRFEFSKSYSRGKNDMIVVDTTGVHRISMVWCECEHADGDRRQDLELLEMGLYPASFENIRTVFTFAVLDDFLLENLECKTSALNYFSKLRRVTSKAFPQDVPNRYQELLRVSRQWRHMKYLKWHGVAYEALQDRPLVSTPAAKGSLAIFCPTCPQPSINLPADWHSQPDQ
jgi:hypothetical protein